MDPKTTAFLAASGRDGVAKAITGMFSKSKIHPPVSGVTDATAIPDGERSGEIGTWHGTSQ